MIDGPDDGFFKLIWGQIVAWSWLIVVALWGGTANYMTKVNSTDKQFSFMELIGEWAVSGFAGLITALLAVEAGWSFYLTAAAAGVAGHMGGRAIALIEEALVRRRGD